MADQDKTDQDNTDQDNTDQDETFTSLSDEELDEQVHAAKGAEAAAINNQGRAAQIAYLTGTEL